MTKERFLSPHIANWLGKCKTCFYWKGVGLSAEDNEVCEKSKIECPRFYIKSNSEEIFEEEEY